METLYYQDRLLLHKLRRQHPQWRLRELAEGVGRSVSWVKKWLKRCTAHAVGRDARVPQPVAAAQGAAHLDQ
jgi:predicted transcriptional regulator